MRNFAIKFLIITASFVVAVLLGEIGLRVAGLEGLKKDISYQEKINAPTSFHVLDEELGWILKPGMKGLWQWEGEAYIEINQEGWRDRERSKTKPENTIRIALLGDSFVEALQVPIEETFWTIIENKLQEKCPKVQGKKVEVINFGVRGYGTAQQLIALRQQVWNYDPDVVILAFFVGNDLINNSPILEYNKYRPFFVFRDGELVEDMSFRDLTPKEVNSSALTTVDKLPAWLVNNSRILQVAKKVEVDNKLRRLSVEYNVLVANNFKNPPDATWEEAWEVTEGLIGLMAKEVEEKKADFFVVFIPDPKQVHYDALDRLRYMRENKIDDFLYPNRQVEKWGDRYDFPVIDLTERFQAYAEENKTCLHGFENSALCVGHWNAEGHRLAGRIIRKQLCQQLIINN